MTFVRKLYRGVALVALLVCASGFTECYKPVTKNQLPTRIRTVAVPAFQNQALRYKIEHRFTEAVIKEVVRRGRGLRERTVARAPPRPCSHRRALPLPELRSQTPGRYRFSHALVREVI